MSWITDLGSYLSLKGGTLVGTLGLADNLLTRPKIKDYSETVNVLGDTGGEAVSIDVEDGNVVTLEVSTGSTTITFTNPSASGTACSMTLIVTNGGSQTFTVTNAIYVGGNAPSLTVSGVDWLEFVTLDGGATWVGFAAGLDVK